MAAKPLPYCGRAGQHAPLTCRYSIVKPLIINVCDSEIETSRVALSDFLV
jgi:hypothetical protein